jgi:glycerol kinase
MSFLAIDQSTTSTSAFIFDENGACKRIFSRTHAQMHPKEGYVEHDPAELLMNVERAVSAGIAAGARAFGLANQGESCLAWDSVTKKAISPVLVWQDARTAQYCEELKRSGYEPMIQARTGLPVSTYFSASKLAWCLTNLPEIKPLLAEGRLRLGTTDAYFRDCLTGRFQTDITTASRTQLMNISTGEWDEGLCNLFGIPVKFLPEITDCNGDLGTVSGLPLLGSIVDQQAALFAYGLKERGQTKMTFGTGAFAMTLMGGDAPSFQGGALPTVAWRLAGQPVTYALDGGLYTASAGLNWARSLGLFAEFSEINTFDAPTAIGHNLVFVPALAGLGCPHWDSAAKGAWFGLSLETTRLDMMQAMLEGIAFRAAEILNEMRRQFPLKGPVHVDGGMAANTWFCQFLADVTGSAISVLQQNEMTALGVARLVAQAAGTDISPGGQQARLYAPQQDLSACLVDFARARRLTQAWGKRHDDRV